MIEIEHIYQHPVHQMQLSSILNETDLELFCTHSTWWNSERDHYM